MPQLRRDREAIVTGSPRTDLGILPGEYRELCRRLEWEQAGIREDSRHRDKIIRDHYRAVAELDRQIDERYSRVREIQQRLDALRPVVAT